MPPKRTKRAGKKVTETDKQAKHKGFPDDITDKDKWEKVTYDKLAVGDYITYQMNARSFKGKQYEPKVNKGYVSMLQDERGDARWKEQDGKVLGMKNYNVSWSNNTKDIGDIYRSLTTDQVRKKGLEKVAESVPKRRELKRDLAAVEREKQNAAKQESKQLEQDPDALHKLAAELEGELTPRPKKPRKPRTKPQPPTS